jgi:hypothetical protein
MPEESGFDLMGYDLTAIASAWDHKPMTFVIAFLCLLIVDNVFCKSLYDVVKTPPKGKEKENPSRKPKPQKSRWFALHTIANLLVCITGVNAVITCIIDPVEATNMEKYPDQSIFGKSTDFPLVMIIMVHFYHMAMFSDLSSADYFHHLMFIPTMGIPGIFYDWGPCQTFLCVFISGLPGGVEYLFLTLSKMGWVNDRSFLKKLAALQNTWCRWPGILIACYNIYIGWLYGILQAHWIAALLIGGLSSFNATFYGFQSISAFTKASIIAQYKKDGDAIFHDAGRNIKVNRPGS